MKKNRILIGLIVFFFLGKQGNGQNSPELYLGWGANSIIQSHSNIVNNTGAQLGFYTPFFADSLLTIGAEATAGYFFSKKTPPLADGINIQEIYSSYVAIQDGVNPEQNVFSLGIGPRLSFSAGKRLLIGAGVSGGLVFIRKTPLSFVQHTVYAYDDSPGGENKENIDKVIYSQDKINTTGFVLTPGIKFDFPVSSNASLWLSGNFSTTTYSYSGTEIPPQSEHGEAYDFGRFIEAREEVFNKKDRSNKLGVSLGLAFRIGKQNKTLQAVAMNDSDGFNSSRSNRPTDIVVSDPSGNAADSADQPNATTRAIGFNSSRSNKPMEDLVTGKPDVVSDSANVAAISEAIGFNSSRSNRPTDIVVSDPSGNAADSADQPNATTRAIGFNSSRSNKPMEDLVTGKPDVVSDSANVAAISEAVGFNSSRSNRPTDIVVSDPSGNAADSADQPNATTRAIGFNSSRSNKPMEDLVTGKPDTVRVDEIAQGSANKELKTSHKKNKAKKPYKGGKKKNLFRKKSADR